MTRNMDAADVVGGRLDCLSPKMFVNALGLQARCWCPAVKISISAVMQPIEISEIVNGERKRIL